MFNIILIDVQDECSFVSLRDVVRALIVFEWFLEKLTGSDDLLMALIREKEGDIQVYS